MPIALPEDLPATAALRSEGIEVLGYRLGSGPLQDGLKVALVNLMPEKAITETQIARLLGASSFLVKLTLVIPDGYAPRTTPASHISRFYKRWSDVSAHSFDALMVTGAPVEHLAFEQVSYWRELADILDWSRIHSLRSLFVCWSAQAALFRFYGVPKRDLAEKAFGVIRQTVRRPYAPLLRDFGADFEVPVSRHTEVSVHDLPEGSRVRVLASSPESGLCLLEDSCGAACYMFNHFEYDAGTLGREYKRDLARGAVIGHPADYFPDDDPERRPINRWRPHARLFFRNWINEIALATGVSRSNRVTMSLPPGESVSKPALASPFGTRPLAELSAQRWEATPK